MRSRRFIAISSLAGWLALALVLVEPRADQDERDDDDIEAAEQATDETAEDTIEAEESARSVSADSEPPAGADREQLDRWLTARIDALVAGRASLANVRVGIQVRDVAGGRVLHARDAETGLSVASCAKIFTAAAALARLGPEFNHRTAVLAEQVDPAGVVPGDLYLRGGGDPGLGVTDLQRLADDLVRAGVTKVNGGLVIDDTYFDDQVTPPRFDEQPDEQASFRAPVSALSIGYNAFTVLVRPAASGTGPAAVTIDPPQSYVRVDKNQLITQASGRNRIYMDTAVEADHIAVSLRGQIRRNTWTRRFRQRIADPARFADAVFRQVLAERGIAIRRRRPARGATPAEAVPLAWIDGAPVAVLVRGLGKYSNNFVAEMLLKTLGAHAQPGDQRTPATWQEGVAAVNAFLAELGVMPGTYRYENGSGLFDATEISPAQIVGVLTAAARNPRWGYDLVAALSIAGVDGTIRRRMHDSPAFGLVRAKTGTLARVSALAGYAAVNRLRPLAFAVVVNDLPDSGRAGRVAKRAARGLQNQVADTLIVYLRARDEAARRVKDDRR